MSTTQLCFPLFYSRKELKKPLLLSSLPPLAFWQEPEAEHHLVRAGVPPRGFTEEGKALSYPARRPGVGTLPGPDRLVSYTSCFFF